MNKLKLNFNIDELSWDKMDDLIPAIVQDINTQQILMLGYMNRESLEKTLQTGRVTFYSRSKKRLWTKGETSNHFLQAQSIVKDCDNDTLLIKAIPEGPTCHLGTTSCFADSAEETADLNFLLHLQNIIFARQQNPNEKSYTSQLLQGGVRRIAQKVGEEGVEVALAAVAQDNAALCNESADLLFHLLVLLQAKGLSLTDVVQILKQRHR